MRRPLTAAGLGSALMASVVVGLLLAKNVTASPINDQSDTSTAVVDRVCFYPQNSGYTVIRGEVVAHTVALDGGVAHPAALNALMQGANLTAAQNMITGQALPLWQAQVAAGSL